MTAAIFHFPTKIPDDEADHSIPVAVRLPFHVARRLSDLATGWDMRATEAAETILIQGINDYAGVRRK